MGKRKKEDYTFLRKKRKEKQNSVTIMIPVNRKGTVRRGIFLKQNF